LERLPTDDPFLCSNKVLEVVKTVVKGESSVSAILSSEMQAERVEDVKQADDEVRAVHD